MYFKVHFLEELPKIMHRQYNDRNINPRDHWIKLTHYYNTLINRANINVFEICHLLGLTLSAEAAPIKFIADMRKFLQRLTKNKVQMNSDRDTIRAPIIATI